MTVQSYHAESSIIIFIEMIEVLTISKRLQKFIEASVIV
jgi:hypothetical protein